MRPARSLSFALALVGGGCAGQARGAPAPWNRVVLVELFTSQGCSSCPPADEWIRDLPRIGLGRDKVVPLTFHVDYWDRLGWPDPFAAPAFTARQDWYARSGRLRPPGDATEPEITGLYTPQMIVDGQVHLPGGKSRAAAAEIRRAAARAPSVELTGSGAVDNDDVVVSVALSPKPAFDRRRDWRLVVALAAKSAETHVIRGENGGETLEEAAVVRTLSERTPLGLDRGAARAGAPARSWRVRLSKPPDLEWAGTEIVAFVQDETTREVAGVALIPLEPPGPRP